MSSEHQTKPAESIIPGASVPGAVRTRHAAGEVEFNYNDITLRIIEELNKHPQELTPLARAAIDSRAQVVETVEALNNVMETFRTGLSQWLQEVRGARMNFLHEINNILTPLRDVRQFFIGPDYEQEIQRMREFVELCERLQKLKEIGLLDAVADSLISLSSFPKQ
jgi:hypothetical protein